MGRLSLRHGGLTLIALLVGKPISTFPEALLIALLVGKPVSTFPEAL
jgi:hypothetical protein